MAPESCGCLFFCVATPKKGGLVGWRKENKVDTYDLWQRARGKNEANLEIFVTHHSDRSAFSRERPDAPFPFADRWHRREVEEYSVISRTL